ncbi:hypothetical protein C1H46_038705 [Malus baccata]|uniref:Ionotropic glutamate receptor C-terminal domain-containing protein n=1 Tax=Malus baccata TaxID=106549 RepID=A0A540KNK2_MALBA|nr:hypothetical protein C1H46_038705 [Malus baccata]
MGQVSRRKFRTLLLVGMEAVMELFRAVLLVRRGKGVIPYLSDALQEVDARIPYRCVISPTATDDQIAAELYKLKGMQTQVFIVQMLADLGSRIFDKAKGIGMMDEGNFNSTNKSRYSTSDVVGLRSIIWPGDSTYAPKGWQIPTSAKRLKVLVPVKPGFSEFVNPRTKKTTVNGGYCIDVLEAVIKSLPYAVPYDLHSYATPNGEAAGAGSYNDLVDQVYLGKYDLAVGDITIRANRSSYVDFTLPYTESGVSMIVPIKDKNSKNAWVFLKPLTWDLWVTSACSFIFIGFVIWVLEHRINQDFRGPHGHQFGTILWYSFSTMVFAHRQPTNQNNFYMKSFLATYCSKYTSIDPTFKADGFALVFPKGSPLARDVSRAILNVTEGEQMKGIERIWFKKQASCADPKHMLSSNRLSLDSFWGLFLIAVGVSLVALLIFAGVFLCKELKNISRELKDLDQGASLWTIIGVILGKYDQLDTKSFTFRCNALTPHDEPPSDPPAPLAAEPPAPLPAEPPAALLAQPPALP